jgi:prepilin signal peptidase PulO-like enzyme (type II secretory pathway)
MRRNRIISLFAFAVLCVFFGILLYRVGRIDLGVVISITLLLAAWDLWIQLFRRRSR